MALLAKEVGEGDVLVSQFGNGVWVKRVECAGVKFDAKDPAHVVEDAGEFLGDDADDVSGILLYREMDGGVGQSGGVIGRLVAQVPADSPVVFDVGRKCVGWMVAREVEFLLPEVGVENATGGVGSLLCHVDIVAQNRSTKVRGWRAFTILGRALMQKWGR